MWWRKKDRTADTPATDESFLPFGNRVIGLLTEIRDTLIWIRVETEKQTSAFHQPKK